MQELSKLMATVGLVTEYNKVVHKINDEVENDVIDRMHNHGVRQQIHHGS